MDLVEMLFNNAMNAEGGGGGGGDFSTAEVKVVDDTGGIAIALNIDNCPVVYDGEPAPAIMSGITVPEASTVTVTVPLFKGICVWFTNNWTETYTVSGNIEDNDNTLIITGDGTVTLTGRA